MRGIKIFTVFAFLLAVISGEARANPAFARKYSTSCQTCHTAFPALNNFGVGFKRNGFMFPSEELSSALIQEKPVALGSEEDKELWPHSVWPASLPGSVPLSVILTGTMRSQPRSSAQNDKFSFDGLGAQATLVTGGVLGKHFPFWGELGFSHSVSTSAINNTSSGSNEVDVERVFLGVKPWTQPWFLAKVGRFEPALTAVSNHRSLLGGYYVTGAKRVGTNRWKLESVQSGVEFSGVLSKDKLAYFLGAVEGATGSAVSGVGNQSNNEKDIYGRLEYKLLGSLWGDKTISLGGFGYAGFSRLASAATNQRDVFGLYGADLTALYKKVQAVLLYGRQENSQPNLGNTAAVSSNHLLGELVWTPLPWFLPAVRYELFDSGATEDQRITTALNFLVRPNLKTFVRMTLDKPDGGDFQDNPDILIGLIGGF